MSSSCITGLICSQCGTRFSDQERQTYCRSCEQSLIVEYDWNRVRTTLTKELLPQRENTLWRYRELLPVREASSVLSIGEGMTPLVRLTGIGKRVGVRNIWLKDESFNPTGSFKARGLSVAVSKAYELGITAMCIPSAGNAGGALAAYAARAGIRASVFIPRDTPCMNIEECRSFGAEVVLVDGVISDAARVMKERYATQPDWFDMSTMKEPYRLEGKKTMGFELAEQFNWQLPDVIVYPTGGGTGLIGMWKAFRELEMLGWIGPARPRMVSVQASGCAPIVKAFESGEPVSSFWHDASTCASGLRVPRAFADRMILQALYDSRGAAVAVTDEEILSDMRTAARTDGLLLCPEGAATIAAVRRLTVSGFINADDRVVVYNTGSAFKYAEVLHGLGG